MRKGRSCWRGSEKYTHMNATKIDSDFKSIMKPLDEMAKKIERKYLLPVKIFHKKFNELVKTEEQRIKRENNGRK
jgi:hypothetical protein